MTKKEKYQELQKQIEALIEGEHDAVAVMANVVAAIHSAMEFFWTGFYIEKNGCIEKFNDVLKCSKTNMNHAYKELTWNVF